MATTMLPYPLEASGVTLMSDATATTTTDAYSRPPPLCAGSPSTEVTKEPSVTFFLQAFLSDLAQDGAPFPSTGHGRNLQRGVLLAGGRGAVRDRHLRVHRQPRRHPNLVQVRLHESHTHLMAFV